MNGMAFMHIHDSRLVSLERPAAKHNSATCGVWRITSYKYQVPGTESTCTGPFVGPRTGRSRTPPQRRFELIDTTR